MFECMQEGVGNRYNYTLLRKISILYTYHSLRTSAALTSKQRQGISRRESAVLALVMVRVDVNVGDVLVEDAARGVHEPRQDGRRYLGAISHPPDALDEPHVCDVDGLDFSRDGNEEVHRAAAVGVRSPLLDLERQAIEVEVLQQGESDIAKDVH